MTMTGSILTARFESWCRARKCRGRIAPGDVVIRANGRTYHESCAPGGMTLEDKRPGSRTIRTDGRWETRRDLE